MTDPRECDISSLARPAAARSRASRADSPKAGYDAERGRYPVGPTLLGVGALGSVTDLTSSSGVSLAAVNEEPRNRRMNCAFTPGPSDRRMCADLARRVRMLLLEGLTVGEVLFASPGTWVWLWPGPTRSINGRRTGSERSASTTSCRCHCAAGPSHDLTRARTCFGSRPRCRCRGCHD